MMQHCLQQWIYDHYAVIDIYFCLQTILVQQKKKKSFCNKQKVVIFERRQIAVKIYIEKHVAIH